MIRNSFLFLPGIKKKKEQSIWQQGINDWDDFLNNKVKGISNRSKPYYDRKIHEAKLALRDNDSGYFYGRFPGTETWRLYDFFKEEAIFLDIETSSATSKESFLTVIGLFDGVDTKIMIRDVNLDISALRRELRKYRLLVTFNGSSFDIPYLNKKYPGLLPKVPHIDVRHLCSKAGLKGGLKQIEQQLGIKRSNIIVERMYGGDPLKLWRMFRGTGDRYYLNLLVDYNEEDLVNLRQILHHVLKTCVIFL
ncbi:ribonuclease H-like domain-containing protein [Candidatus Woesearchaeota archaeon]|nr:ribonuclease H-like domain-containing protein [Candidatus Woesearchaeota archaeon]